MMDGNRGRYQLTEIIYKPVVRVAEVFEVKGVTAEIIIY